MLTTITFFLPKAKQWAFIRLTRSAKAISSSSGTSSSASRPSFLDLKRVEKMVLDYKTFYCPSVSDYVSDGRTGHKRQRVRPIRKESWQSSEICDQCHSATFIKEWEWYQAYFLERISYKGAIKHKETIIMSRHLNYEHIEKLKNPSENKRRYINQLFYDPTLSKTTKDYHKKRPSVQDIADSCTDDSLQMPGWIKSAPMKSHLRHV